MPDIKQLPLDIKGPPFDLKIYLNGFPKSGLHLLERYVATFVDPIPCDHMFFNEPWASTFYLNAWSCAWIPLNQIAFKIGRLGPNQYIKGHGGYQAEFERFLWNLGIVHIFVFRDMRDVAVSQAFHIMTEPDENRHLYHPERGAYLALGGFDQILKAVIAGYHAYPGVMQRWVYYEGWLNVPWVLCLRYEDMVEHREKVAERILDYSLSRAASIYSSKPLPDPTQKDEILHMMVENSHRTDLCVTFRKGEIGGWKEHFTEQHKALFKKVDPGWLKVLGYEAGDDW